MDQKDYKELIRSNYTKLIDSLRGDIENVCNFLYEKKIITISMKENTLCQKTPGRQSSHLLSLIVTRGARAFGALYEACKLNNLKDAVDILEPSKAPYKSSTATGAIGAMPQEEEQPLPAKWPSPGHFEKVKNRKLHVKKVSRDRKSGMLETYQTHLNTVDIYPMYHKIRGNALIILNENFDGITLKSRIGSEWDRLGLEQLFTGLGFEVNMLEDLSVEKIIQAIKEEMYKDHSDHDCFVFFILSHGRRGEILDKRCAPISMKSIIDNFNEIDDLRGKPKLLFFQACQGKTDDTGISGTNDTGIAGISQSQSEDDISITRHDGDGVERDTESLSIPQYVDVFVFRSSPDDTLSYRNTNRGSWFTQSVIYVFSEFAHICELCDLQLKVNDLLSKAETWPARSKNVGEFVFVPGKKFYFFPGLFTDL